MTTGAILTLNAGSSSLKFAVFEADGSSDTPDALACAVRGAVENLHAAPHLVARDAQGAVLLEQRWPGGLAHPFATVLAALLAFADTLPGAGITGRALAAVGHRVVHGGPDHGAPERLTAALLAGLQALTPLDPLHMPHNLAPMRAIAAARPDLSQMVCFDTAFHHTMPRVAQRFALPRAVSDAGVRRYGFHGLSYEYVASRLPDISPRLAAGRVIVAHLGSGASLCALLAGRSIETTTGFSALDGLMMATRCGAIDPGVLLYLSGQGRSLAEIEDMLYRRSGLLGVSGISDDVRVLLSSGHPHAAEALELYTYRIAAQAAGLASALGGLDGLVFTAGIGEHAAPVRAAVCARLAWLGVRLDARANEAGADDAGADEAGANEAGAGLISTQASAVEVRVIATDEEAMIARHSLKLVQTEMK